MKLDALVLLVPKSFRMQWKKGPNQAFTHEPTNNSVFIYIYAVGIFSMAKEYCSCALTTTIIFCDLPFHPSMVINEGHSLLKIYPFRSNLPDTRRGSFEPNLHLTNFLKPNFATGYGCLVLLTKPLLHNDDIIDTDYLNLNHRLFSYCLLQRY